MKKGTVLIGFVAPKGGVGKSVFTTLIASYLHYQTDKQVIVVDCDFPQFSVATMRARDMEQVNNSDYYRLLAYNQFTSLNKKAYPILKASPETAINTLSDFLTNGNHDTNYDIALFDLPGTVNSHGVLATVAKLDYVFVPIISDYIVLDSCLKFADVLNENLLKKGTTNIKGLYLFWNMVNNSEKTTLYDAYEDVIRELELPLLNTRIPDLVRFKKEILSDRKTVFRSTLFPISKKLIGDSNIEPLIAEIMQIIKL